MFTKVEPLSGEFTQMGEDPIVTLVAFAMAGGVIAAITIAMRMRRW